MPTVVEPPDPGYDRTVLTPDHQLHPQLHAAAFAPNQADKIGAAVTPAHAVDQGDSAIRTFEPGLQDQAAKAMRDEEMLAEIEDFLEGFNQPTYRGMRVNGVRVATWSTTYATVERTKRRCGSEI